jgi:hypothetical protein
MAGRAGRSGGHNKLSLARHVAAGTYRKDRHGPLPANVLPMPMAAQDWRPSPTEIRGLGPQAVALLEATLAAYQLSPIEGVHVLVALRALTRLEALEAELARDGTVSRDGAPSPYLAAIARERRSFEMAWAVLRLER